jgi:beta-glucosidase
MKLTTPQKDWEGEGADRASMELPGRMDALIAAVAAANPSTVVVMQSGTPVEMPWVNDVNALVHAWYGGNETGNAIADVLFGDVNPGAKLSLSFPKRVQDNPAYLNYTSQKGRTIYGEDVYIGYRFYEATQKEVLFPFGHGLSYTTFAFSDLAVTADVEELTVSLTVTNTGSVAGAEVVQLYVSQDNPSIPRPPKELKGFKKIFLQPGASEVVEIKVQVKYAASFWDEERSAWVVEKDTYRVLVGDSSASSAEKTVKGSFEVAATRWWNGL